MYTCMFVNCMSNSFYPAAWLQNKQNPVDDWSFIGYHEPHAKTALTTANKRLSFINNNTLVQILVLSKITACVKWYGYEANMSQRLTQRNWNCCTTVSTDSISASLNRTTLTGVRTAAEKCTATTLYISIHNITASTWCNQWQMFIIHNNCW